VVKRTVLSYLDVSLLVSTLFVLLDNGLCPQALSWSPTWRGMWGDSFLGLLVVLCSHPLVLFSLPCFSAYGYGRGGFYHGGPF
jgi:hypothetical protein